MDSGFPILIVECRLIKFEQVGHNFFFISTKVNTICRFDSGIKSLVCISEVVRHFVRIVQLSKRPVGIVIPGLQKFLSSFLYCSLLRF